MVSHWPRTVLLLALVLAGVSIAVTVFGLEFQSNRNDLISEDLPWNQRFIAWRNSFGGQSDLFVIVDTFNEADRPDPDTDARARELIDSLAQRLNENPQVREVVHGYDTGEVPARAMRLQAMDEFEQNLARIAEAEPILASPTPQALIQQATQQMQAQQQPEQPSPADRDPVAEDIGAFQSLIETFTRRMQTPAEDPVSFDAQGLAQVAQNGWQYLRTENERFLIMRLTPVPAPGALSPYHQSIQAVRSVLEEHREAYPDLKYGVTGTVVIEADETAAAMTDSTMASVLAIVLITVLLVTAFQSIRMPLLMVVALLTGIAWSFGFLTLAIGHLQVISVIFTVILLGLGVAFGIHLVSRFELVRYRYEDNPAGFADSLRDTLETIGPGLLTGAITTAAAFGTTLLTDFRGVAEMGLIAAAGILLCLLAMCSVLPALLRLIKPGRRHVVDLRKRRVHLFDERWVMPFVRHPKITLLVAALVTVVSLGLASQIRFDYNLLALMPRGMDSIQWQQRIAEEGEQSVYSGVSIVHSMDEARELASRYRQMPLVDSVGGIGMLIPRNESAKLQRLQELREQLAPVLPPPGPEDVDAPPNLVQQIAGLRWLLQAAAWQAPEPLQAALGDLNTAVDEFLQTAQQLPDEQRQARLAALQEDYERWRDGIAQLVTEALDDRPPELEDLPTELLTPYVARTERGLSLAMEIYPALPPGIDDPLDPRYLGTFVEAVQEVDPEVTGTMVQLYKSGELIWRAYLAAGLYALLAVLVLVWVDFRSLGDAIMTLMPVAVGFAVTFGVMHLVGMAITPANIIVLPLMFGIGVDAGVHLLHRYRQNPGTRPLGLTAGTGKGITITSLTSMIGFGVLLIAQHRGIASLGFVLGVGLGMTLLACWTLMPACLELRQRRHEARAVAETPAPI